MFTREELTSGILILKTNRDYINVVLDQPIRKDTLEKLNTITNKTDEFIRYIKLYIDQEFYNPLSLGYII